MIKRKEESTPQKLAGIIKSCRKIMRKDKGLSGDLDRLPMLRWIMFLKFFDDMEKIREKEAELSEKRYESPIEPPYRWRDWAEKEEGISGDELISFINNDEAVRPDGTRGDGLFAHLRSLEGVDGGDRRDVIATVFRGIQNRMTNGYLLKDVVNKINSINFTSSEEIHTLSYLYESMLKELRDAAGDSGEFYTPRPVVKLIVDMVNPQLGEQVLDPAAGTGGFLVETYAHLNDQCNTGEDYNTLQRKSLFGGEAKPLPYLLGQMNLVLHGLEYPEIDSGNSLRFPLREIGNKDRVDVIITNPPFGGEEEAGILTNFPQDKQTSETALLFLQLIMRKLKKPIGNNSGGRCGMVVPNGTLFGDGIAARIKKDLLQNFNLHTIIRLPKGVFKPYTGIETNLLFFERDGPTKEIWYYAHPLPPERQKLTNPCYVKTKPLQYEEFEPLKEWWYNREENEHAWKVPVKDIITNNYDLDIVNPNIGKKKEYPPPEKVIKNAIDIIEQVYKLTSEIKIKVRSEEIKKNWQNVRLGDILEHKKEFVLIDDFTTYKRVTAKLHAKGIVIRDKVEGIRIKTKKQQICKKGDFLVAEIDAKVGGFGIVPQDLEGAIVSSHYFLFKIDKEKVKKKYLDYYIRTPDFQNQINAKGSTNYASIRPSHVENIEIPLPSLEEQRKVIVLIDKVMNLIQLQNCLLTITDELKNSILDKAFKGEL